MTELQVADQVKALRAKKVATLAPQHDQKALEVLAHFADDPLKTLEFTLEKGVADALRKRHMVLLPKKEPKDADDPSKGEKTVKDVFFVSVPD